MARNEVEGKRRGGQARCTDDDEHSRDVPREARLVDVITEWDPHSIARELSERQHASPQRVCGKPRSTFDVAGSGQRAVTTFPRV